MRLAGGENRWIPKNLKWHDGRLSISQRPRRSAFPFQSQFSVSEEGSNLMVNLDSPIWMSILSHEESETHRFCVLPLSASVIACELQTSLYKWNRTSSQRADGSRDTSATDFCDTAFIGGQVSLRHLTSRDTIGRKQSFTTLAKAHLCKTYLESVPSGRPSLIPMFTARAQVKSKHFQFLVD